MNTALLTGAELRTTAQISPAEFDAIVVGAGIAGCTVARLFAFAGLRVALVEHHADVNTFKQLCTHFIQASATPTIQRLGLDRLIEDAGAVRNSIDIWTRYGWIGANPPLDDTGNSVFGYNVQRRTLDPILRKLAIETTGVTSFLGCHVHRLFEQKGQVIGVELAGVHSVAFLARLVVGADGRNSPLATLAGVKPRSSENTRCAALGAYIGVALKRGRCSQMWICGPDVGYVFPNDGGVTVAVYVSTKDKIESFRPSPRQALTDALARFPDAPDLSLATPAGQVLLVKDYANLWRPPVARNIAFVGDALMSVDFVPGVGCGFAFQTAEWLVDALAPALAEKRCAAEALKSYARDVSRKLNGHRFFICDYARRRKFNVPERLVFSAAAKDVGASRHLHAFASRSIGPTNFISPRALLRATWINLSRPASRSAQTDAPV